MREIKFRGKGIEEHDKNKWYYGYYVKLDKTTYCFKEDYERNKDNSEHKILFDVMTDWGLPNQHKMADININTLGQFTGLYDKNNVAIYEGDIVKYEDEKYKYVVMFDPTGYWCLDGNGIRNSEMLIQTDDTNKYIEIVGNIYEEGESDK